MSRRKPTGHDRRLRWGDGWIVERTNAAGSTISLPGEVHTGEGPEELSCLLIVKQGHFDGVMRVPQAQALPIDLNLRPPKSRRTVERNALVSRSVPPTEVLVGEVLCAIAVPQVRPPAVEPIAVFMVNPRITWYRAQDEPMHVDRLASSPAFICGSPRVPSMPIVHGLPREGRDPLIVGIIDQSDLALR
jgi:hypothetical protein